MDRAPESLRQVRTTRVALRLFLTGRWHLLRHARWIAEYEASE